MALTTNIFAYYKLDGDSVDVISANNGTDTGITYSAGNGKIVQGAGFGATGKIVLPSVAGFQYTSATALSINLWIKWSSVSTSGAFASYFQNGTPFYGWSFYRNDGQAGSNGLNFYMNAVGGELKLGVSGSNLGANAYDGSWHMLTITYSGGNSSANINMYLDATLASGNTYSGSATTSPIYTTFQMNLGAENGTAEMNGNAMDEIGFWSRAITSSEVTQLWNSGVGLAYPFVSSAPDMRLAFI